MPAPGRLRRNRHVPGHPAQAPAARQLPAEPSSAGANRKCVGSCVDGVTETACALHFAYSNFCRINKRLRVTPAMQAGLTDYIWILKESSGSNFQGKWNVENLTWCC